MCLKISLFNFQSPFLGRLSQSKYGVLPNRSGYKAIDLVDSVSEQTALFGKGR